MPTELTAEEQAAVSAEQRRNVVGLRALACRYEGAAMEADNDEDRAFIRGLADKCRKGADDIESALDSGQPMEDVIRLVAKLWGDCTRPLLSGDIDDANITPRQE